MDIFRIVTSPVDIVVVLIVTTQGDERTDSQTVRKEDLRHGINPNLETREE
jgi:hypothetical protein